MAHLRSSQISLTNSLYHHGVSRCVPWSFLCGTAAALLIVIQAKVMNTAVSSLVNFLSEGEGSLDVMHYAFYDWFDIII